MQQTRVPLTVDVVADVVLRRFDEAPDDLDRLVADDVSQTLEDLHFGLARQPDGLMGPDVACHTEWTSRTSVASARSMGWRGTWRRAPDRPHAHRHERDGGSLGSV